MQNSLVLGETQNTEATGRATSYPVQSLKEAKFNWKKTITALMRILVCTRVCTRMCSGGHPPAPCPSSESDAPGAALRSAAPARGLPFRPPELLTRGAGASLQLG